MTKAVTSADKPENKDTEPKKYTLSETERKFIEVINMQANQLISVYITNILLERFNYPVTPKTQFKITDGVIEVGEQIQVSEQPPQEVK